MTRKRSDSGRKALLQFENKGAVLIILAGIFWGTMGLFVRSLGAFGFTPVQIVCFRLIVAAVVFAVISRVKEGPVKIPRRDIPLFLGLGLGSVLIFTCCYFTAIQMMPMSVAAILLYTSPIWVMLMAVLFLHEQLTRVKVMALVLSFAGCVLVSGIGGGKVAPLGFVIGLCSGIGYGLYSILGTLALKKYSAYTVTSRTFIIAAVGCLAISSPADMAAKAAACGNGPFLAVLVVMTGIVTAVVPFLCYTLGLSTVPAGKAAILATVEPMVATLLGALVYHESLTLVSGCGILCILAAVVILNRKSPEPGLEG